MMCTGSQAKVSSIPWWSASRVGAPRLGDRSPIPPRLCPTGNISQTPWHVVQQLGTAPKLPRERWRIIMVIARKPLFCTDVPALTERWPSLVTREHMLERALAPAHTDTHAHMRTCVHTHGTSHHPTPCENLQNSTPFDLKPLLSLFSEHLFPSYASLLPRSMAVSGALTSLLYRREWSPFLISHIFKGKGIKIPRQPAWRSLQDKAHPFQ